MGKDYTENVQLFKAFCDENRWRILEILQEGERCACVLLNELEISQSTLSHHMRILCDSGVVVGRKDIAAADSYPWKDPDLFTKQGQAPD